MYNLTWGPEFRTGIDEIDTDHRQLFKIYNDLAGLMEMGGGAEYVGDTLGELIDYTKMHFSREEELLEARGCPSDVMEQHRFEHQALLDEAEILVGKAAKDPSYRLSNETLKFLGDWLSDHTRGTDKRCAAMVNSG